jgi:hypothetical protein
MVIVLATLVFLFVLEFIRILRESMVRDYEVEIERSITSDNNNNKEE